VFLVDAGGTIRWMYSNPDYKIRPDNAAILDAARALAKAGRDEGSRPDGRGER